MYKEELRKNFPTKNSPTSRSFQLPFPTTYMPFKIYPYKFQKMKTQKLMKTDESASQSSPWLLIRLQHEVQFSELKQCNAEIIETHTDYTAKVRENAVLSSST